MAKPKKKEKQSRFAKLVLGSIEDQHDLEPVTVEEIERDAEQDGGKSRG